MLIGRHAPHGRDSTCESVYARAFGRLDPRDPSSRPLGDGSVCCCSEGGTRTRDTTIMSRVLVSAARVSAIDPSLARVSDLPRSQDEHRVMSPAGEVWSECGQVPAQWGMTARGTVSGSVDPGSRVQACWIERSSVTPRCDHPGARDRPSPGPPRPRAPWSMRPPRRAGRAAARPPRRRRCRRGR